MKRTLSIIFALIGWFAIVIQYYLMLENRVAGIPETTIRFFSFFTILTNLLATIYFTRQAIVGDKNNRFNSPGVLTAITVYISIVGLVYQLILRQIWEPEGLSMLVDELLHSVNPLLVICFWYLYENKQKVSFKQIPRWLIYPLVYLIFILFRGSISEFYPYPFVDVSALGLSQVLINSAGLLLVFFIMSALFVFTGKRIGKRSI
tara:strand:+ start:1647 stop:2261 length:615 start_codon:yes stop_codon:yes gene_type:complete